MLAEVTPTSTQRKTKIVHQGRFDKANAFWAKPDAPEERDSAIDGFMEKVFQLRVRGYPKADPEPGAMEKVLVVKLAPDRGEPISIEVGRGQAAEGGEPQWFARSELTKSWANVSPTLGADLAEALAGILQ